MQLLLLPLNGSVSAVKDGLQFHQPPLAYWSEVGARQ
jgi:hypothetical protein